MVRMRGIKLAKFQVRFVKENCMGCGNCEIVCPENWQLVGGYSRPLKTELGEVGCNERAATECPESCIEIVEH